MKRLLSLILLLFIIISCSGRKQVEKSLNTGNYDRAITDALEKLETNKDKKRKQDYILMLHNAYNKAVDRDLNTLKHLQNDNNPVVLTDIYNLYSTLNIRQERIKPILPLQVNGKTIQFKFNDYGNSILNARNKASSYLYQKGVKLLQSDSKSDAREAFNVFEYIESINPGYKDIRELMDSAHIKGIDYILVSIENNTNQIIPKQLEDDLLNFDTYGLNQFWTQYHSIKNPDFKYDYAMQLLLKQINISPERIIEREHVREKEIVDGWEYQLDSDGNVMKDSLGNDIKIDKIVLVKARYLESEQVKSSQIIADVHYSDLLTNQVLESFPIDSGFVFENIFATYRGDKRALTPEDLDLINNRRVPFPSHEQMVYDTGEDLKYKLKNIINSYDISR